MERHRAGDLKGGEKCKKVVIAIPVMVIAKAIVELPHGSLFW
jgi:hypothetical protein